MKKVDFLDLVCASLARMGVEDAEIRIQRQNMDRYLTGMGVGEESPALDSENPVAFAKLICGNIAKKKNASPCPVASEPHITAAPKESDDFAEEMPNVEVVEAISEDASDVQSDTETFIAPDTEEDIKIFGGSHAEKETFIAEELPAAEEPPVLEDTFEQSTAAPIAFEEDVQESFDGGYAEMGCAPADTYAETPMDEQYGYDDGYAEYAVSHTVAEEEPYYEEPSTEYAFAPQDSNGTIEFNVPKLNKKTVAPKSGELEAEEDYFEKSDDDDYVPSGNPALFWVLAALTSFLWIPLLLVLTVAVGLGFVLMLIFEAVYVPSIVVIIIGGSAVSFAELIYSIIKFAGKNPAVALFELGLGLLVAALTFGLPTAMYYLGVSVFPGWIKNYGRNVKRFMRKLRRIYRKLKGVCSI